MDYIIELLICVPVVLISLTFHECAHGFAAYKLGDPTAKQMGRLSLNPLRHIDPIGALCMLIFRFGWAKPVPIDTRYFKNPKSGMAITALAGPAANILLGFIGCFLYTLSARFMIFVSGTFAYYLAYAWLKFVFYFGWLNIALAIFNLIPLPPLDGSRIFLVFLPEKAYFSVMKYEREIALGFFIILFLDSRLLGGHITGALSTVVYFIFNGFVSLFNLIF
ncbi:MAG: site-2 protease family protein [Eubacteriales bacterium]